MPSSNRGQPFLVEGPGGHDGPEQGSAARPGLPEELRPLFWDCDFEALQLRQSPQFIINRVMVSGSWSHISWLRHAVGDSALRHWILKTEGRLLSRKQLRFWELILKLPTAEVDRWLADTSREVWDNRVCR